MVAQNFNFSRKKYIICNAQNRPGAHSIVFYSITMDSITISRLRCSAHIGCEEDERAVAQALLVTATVELDTREAAATDDLAKTVNYAQLSKQLMRCCEESRCKLIETLAEHLAEICLNASDRVMATTIEIQKPAGVKHADFASLTISRRRDLKSK